MKIGIGATKALSLLIVWCMVFSAFAGMLVLLVPGAGQALEPSVVDGDLYIGEEYTNSTLIVNGGAYNLNGNLTVRSGGVVTITNGALNMLSSAGDFDGTSFNRVHHIIVEDGGELNIVDSEIRTEPVLFNVTPALGILIRNGGSLYAENSHLSFQGHIMVDEGSFVAYGSSISGPLFTAMSSTVELYGSVIEEIPGVPLTDDTAYSYTFASATANDIEVGYTFQRNPDTARTTVPTGTADYLTADDLNNVTVATGTGIAISGFDIGGLFFNEGEASSVTLNALYKTADDFVSAGNTFRYAEYLTASAPATGMAVEPTYEAYSPSTTNQYMVISHDLTALGLSSLDLSVLSVTFDNTASQDVMIDRVWIEVQRSIPAYHNITLAGNTEFTAVDTHLGVNYDNYTNMSSHRKMTVMDGATANLYGVSVNGTFFDGGLSPFQVVESTIQLKPLAQGSDDTGETSVLDLLFNDGEYYYADSGETIWVTQFNIAGMVAPISKIVVTAEFGANVGYNTPQFLQWNVTGTSLTNMDIVVATSTPTVDSTEIATDSLVNLAQLSSMNIVFNNQDPAQVSFDLIWVQAVLYPSINIYRWAEVDVVDTNGLPVSGAEVVARGPGGSPATYFYDGTENLMPPTNVLAYMGVNESTYGITDDLGLVTLPLLTDVVDPKSYPNSHPVTAYAIIATYEDLAAMNYTTSLDTTFDPYPDMTIQTIEMHLVLVDLELALPDLVVSGITTTPVTMYENDPATVEVNVTNLGLNTAGEFLVEVTDSIGNVTNHLGNITISSLASGATTSFTVPWLSNFTAAGSHVITVTVDVNEEIMEVDEANKFYETVIVMPLLADLAVDEASITFSDNPGLARETLTISVEVSNEGRIAANMAVVTYYLGNPVDGGVTIGQSTISVPNGVTASTGLDWIPIQIGTYPIYVVVNSDRSIVEYSYSNNMAFNTLRVDIQANEERWRLVDQRERILVRSRWFLISEEHNNRRRGVSVLHWISALHAADL